MPFAGDFDLGREHGHPLLNESVGASLGRPMRTEEGGQHETNPLGTPSDASSMCQHVLPP